MKTPALAVGVSIVALAGCGSSKPQATSPGSTPKPSSSAPAAGGGHAAARPDPLRVVATRRLPAAVQLPGLARVGSTVLALGGLSAADSSVGDVVRVAPGAPKRVGSLPQPVHDIGVADLGGHAYAFGGGTASGPIDSITRVDPDGRSRVVGHLPARLSDTSAATIGDTAYIVGGYTTTTPLRSVLAFRPGQPVRDVATLPHPLRYPAVAAIGGRILVAGGTNGSVSRPEVLSIDPATHRVKVIARLPVALAHAAGVALGGTFYVIGGREAPHDNQRRGIWAIDPKTGRMHAAGRLPRALSDLAAVPIAGGRILVVGGRDVRGRAQSEVLELAPGPAGAPKPAKAATPTKTTAALPRLAPPPARADVYAADRPGMLAPQVRNDPPRIYVPNSQSNTVDVVDQRTAKVVDHFAVGTLPQHVTPSWDLRTLWVTNDLGNSLTPIDAHTGRHGKPVPVLDPYNLYFTADGKRAIVVAEAHRQLDFRTPQKMELRKTLKVPDCAGVDHMDFTADGHYALASCEFAGRAIVVDLNRETLVKTIDLRRGAMPQDVKLSPDGRTFYVADMATGGVWIIDAQRMRKVRFQPTGRGAHGLYPSRDSRYLYVSNRGEGSITVISFKKRKPVRKWHIPGGGSPDMGGVSADGRVLWLTGRYNGELYALSTRTGKLLHRVRVGAGPHGACVWPQPGRYSIGHTGILR